MNDATLSNLLSTQKHEITEHHIYKNIAKGIKDEHNKKIIEHIAQDELKHYEMLKKITKRDVSPDILTIFWYRLLSFLFGFTFALKLLERGEHMSAETYKALSKDYPELAKSFKDEEKHELEILKMLEEERVVYAGDIVLGLNDALVELTGALAGLTFSLQNGKLIALSGLVVGIAASLSMAASNYLSSREDKEIGEKKDPIFAASVTGLAYLVTVLILVSPYFLLEDVFLAFWVMVALVVSIVAFYNCYIGVVRDQPFWPRFIEMALVSGGVMLISYFVGTFLKAYLGVEV